MRRAALLMLATALAWPAPADAKEKLTASPSVVTFGQTLAIRGSGWPVIEFCSRKVRL